MFSKCQIAILIVLTTFVAGCCTYTEAPGARGKVLDRQTRASLRGALITRKSVRGALYGTSGMDRNVSQASSTQAGKSGAFDLRPVLHTQIGFMHRRNPERIQGLFLVKADGYDVHEVNGYATSRSRWRVNFGDIFLDRMSARTSETGAQPNDGLATPQRNSDGVGGGSLR
jgi:hypothetical protein